MRNRNILAMGIILLLISIGIIPSSTSITFYDDNTPPITVIYFNGTLGENNWYVSDIIVTLKAIDDESGVDETYYRLNDGDWEVYVEPFIVSDDGIHIIKYYSVDNAGNIEDIKSGGFAIDQTPPIVLFACTIKGPERPSIKVAGTAEDRMSCLERVELYFILNWELIGTSYESPFSFLFFPECNVNVRGLIFPPRFSNDYMSFLSIYVKASIDLCNALIPYVRAYDKAGNVGKCIQSGPIECHDIYKCIFKHLSFTKNYSGRIGLFYIDASFKYERE